MKIAVTDTNKEDSQKLYLDWLKLINPEAQVVVVSYRNNFSDLSGFDGLMLTGGEDIDSEKSKAAPVEFVKKSDKRRDEFEFGLLDQALKLKIPVLSICRGMQVANVFFGGTLVADLEHDGFDRHSAPDEKSELRHMISVDDRSLLKEIVGVQSGEVNSHHHQAVKKVADDFTASSFSHDGVVESLEWKEKKGKSFLLAVQWHPERMPDRSNPFTQKIGEAFFKAVRNFKSLK